MAPTALKHIVLIFVHDYCRTIRGSPRWGICGYHLLLWCPGTQIWQQTRNSVTRAGWDDFAVSYCLCCFSLCPLRPIGQNSCSGAGISSVLSNLGNQAGDSNICLVLGLPYTRLRSLYILLLFYTLHTITTGHNLEVCHRLGFCTVWVVMQQNRK